VNGEGFYPGKKPPRLRLELSDGIVRSGELLHRLERVE
jgi:hypothetical protein